MFERPFGQTNEQAKKAEEILAGSSLNLEEEENKGQVHHYKSQKIKSIDDAYKISDDERVVAEEKLNNSVLKNATLEDKEN